MPSEMKMQAPSIEEIGVNFPFILVLEHPAVDLKGMFDLTQAFDMYEMERDAAAPEAFVKENILVDVLECTPTVTTIKITPAETMSYARMAKHTDIMLNNLGKRLFKGKAKIIRLAWEIDKTGVSSDLRGMLRKVS
ncbi:MAG TPA: hypothetical protein VI818_05100 [Candidatus Thermoplasmatota archaeon]|nr:hypothetical protein [Candidatus Thermoplasmatota archaeon]